MSEHIERAAEVIFKATGRRLADGTIVFRNEAAAEDLHAAGLLVTPAHDAAVAAAWLRAVKVQVENAKSIILKTVPAASSEWQHGHDAGSHVAIDAVLEMIDAVIAEDVPEREGGQP